MWKREDKRGKVKWAWLWMWWWKGKVGFGGILNKVWRVGGGWEGCADEATA